MLRRLKARVNDFGQRARAEARGRNVARRAAAPAAGRAAGS